MDLLNFIIARGKEASTYAGLSAILAAVHINMTPAVQNAWVAVAMSVAGLLAVLIPEKKS